MFHRTILCVLASVGLTGPARPQLPAADAVRICVARSITGDALPDSSVRVLPWCCDGATPPDLLRSGPDGEVCVPRTAGHFLLVVSAAGYQDSVLGPLDLASSLGAKRVFLVRGAAISATIVDRRGFSVANARIELMPEDDLVRRVIDSGGLDGFSTVALPRAACSDEQGRFVFEGLADGAYQLIVRHDGGPSLVRAIAVHDGVGTLDPRLVVEDGAELSLRLSSRRSSSREVRVALTRLDGPAECISAAGRLGSEFVLPAVAPGAHVLEVEVDGVGMHTMISVEQASRVARELTLPALGPIEIDGGVLDASGRPTDGFLELVFRDESGQEWRLPDVRVPVRGGRFHATLPCAGHYQWALVSALGSGLRRRVGSAEIGDREPVITIDAESATREPDSVDWRPGR